MSHFLFLWIGAGLFFLIIEILTTAFYGLALAISAFGVALYVWITGETNPTFMQGCIFVILSAFGAYGFPRFFSHNSKESPQGLDVYIGKTRKVKKVGEDLKISLDGVDYLIESDGLKAGDSVQITSRNGSLFTGKILP